MRRYSAMQELYDALFAYCKNQLGIDTYDTLPGEVPYPFIVLDSTQTITDAYKVGAVPTEVVTMQIFAKREQRKQLNLLVESLNDLRKITTLHYTYYANANDNSINTLEEEDGNDELLHTTVDMHFTAYQTRGVN